MTESDAKNFIDDFEKFRLMGMSDNLLSHTGYFI